MIVFSRSAAKTRTIAIAVTAAAVLAASAVLAAGLAGRANPITASSELKPGKFSYYASNAVDLDTETAWVEGVPGLGTGQWISLYLGDANTLAGLNAVGVEIFSGYQKSYELFQKNAAPMRVRASLIDGNKTRAEKTVTAQSPEGGRFYFDFPGLAGAPVEQDLVLKIEVLAARPGSKYDDTCVTEILTELKGPNPNGAKMAATKFCSAVMNRSAADLKEFTSQPLPQIVDEFTNEFTEETMCAPDPVVRSETVFDLHGAEGGDGGVLCRFKLQGSKWRLKKCAYISRMF